MKIQLSLPPAWERISHVRQALTRLVFAVFRDQALAHEVSMAAAELLENGVKYGSAAPISLTVSHQGAEIAIRVRNGIDHGSPSRDTLLARLEWIRSFADPADAYLAALSGIAESDPSSRASSGLGLVRIVCEGGCRLDCEPSAPNEIALCARREVPAHLLEQ